MLMKKRVLHDIRQGEEALNFKVIFLVFLVY